MRASIRNKLINHVPEIGERVYEPHAAGPKTEKPYIVIRQGVDVEDTPWTQFRRIIEIWPYISRTSFKSVDALAQKVIKALDKELLATEEGDVFSCLYLGAAGPDVVDDEWGVITRGLRFAVIALQPAAVPETVQNDPWIESLASWTESKLGPEWNVYRNLWPMGYVRPSILWRLDEVRVENATRSVFKVIKTIKGHLVGNTPNEELAGVLFIIQTLMQDIKIPLDLDARKYLTVEKPVGDYKADSLTKGQISLTLTRLTSRPTEEVSTIQRIHGRFQFE